ncbi:MAG: helix-turn-helix transcriptional regulator [Lactobacillaceae bacterium]|jgi:transcriptional regulator with XRE-family HTH domain|nr:helix-turn-helix transcriptional regulator [Lactobacillaceae bacterium]
MLPNRLKQLRNSRGLTLDQLATELNKNLPKGEKANTGAQIGNWERGERKPDYPQLIRMADFFDVSVDYLIGRFKIETTDLLQMMLTDNVIFDQRTLTQQDKVVILKLIQSYFRSNRIRTDVDKMFDQQSELTFDWNDSNDDNQNN